jgi:hypothetical protein
LRRRPGASPSSPLSGLAQCRGRRRPTDYKEFLPLLVSPQPALINIFDCRNPSGPQASLFQQGEKVSAACRSSLPEKGLSAAVSVAFSSAAVAAKKHGSLSTMSEQGGPTRAGRVRPLLRPRGGRGATNKRVNPLYPVVAKAAGC